MEQFDEIQYEFEKALLDIDRVKPRAIFEDIINKANSVEDIIKAVEKIVVVSLKDIGDGWEEGKISLAQVYMSGKICDELVSTLIPNMDSYLENQPKIAICCFEDYHLIGKRIVSALIRVNRFKLIDYGCGIKMDKLINNITKDKIEIIIISTLMLPSAIKIKEVRKALDLINPNIKILVGGAPFLFDLELWKYIGAYAMGKDAIETINIIKSIVEGGIKDEGIYFYAACNHDT